MNLNRNEIISSGLEFVPDDYSFMWMDGSLLSWSAFNSNFDEPVDPANRRCIRMSNHNNGRLWRTFECTPKKYLCENPGIHNNNNKNII